MSIAARSGRWLRRKLRQVGEGTLGRHGIHLPTVAWLTLMPSLSNSPWMRGAPHNGLARLMRRIKSRISVPVLAGLDGVIASANRAEIPCDATRPGLRA